MKEKLQEYALVAEIISAIAIIASLLFVGYEIKQNSEAQVQTNTQLVVGEWISSIRTLSNNPDMSCIYGKGISDFNSLSGQESLMFSAYMLSQFYITQDMFYLALDDAINDDIWSGFRQTSLEILSYPGVQDWLDLRKHWFSEEFQLFLEENMNQSFSGDLVYFDDSNCS